MNQWINPFKPQSAIGNPQSSIAILLPPALRNAPKSKIPNPKSKIVPPLAPDFLVSNLQSAILNLQSPFPWLLPPALPIRNPKSQI